MLSAIAVLPSRREHAAAQTVGGREDDGVQEAVETIPARCQRLPGGGQLLGDP
jgi:hypothetical protein